MKGYNSVRQTHSTQVGVKVNFVFLSSDLTISGKTSGKISGMISGVFLDDFLKFLEPFRDAFLMLST